MDRSAERLVNESARLFDEDGFEARAINCSSPELFRSAVVVQQCGDDEDPNAAVAAGEPRLPARFF